MGDKCLGIGKGNAGEGMGYLSDPGKLVKAGAADALGFHAAGSQLAVRGVARVAVAEHALADGAVVAGEGGLGVEQRVQRLLAPQEGAAVAPRAGGALW